MSALGVQFSAAAPPESHPAAAAGRELGTFEDLAGFGDVLQQLMGHVAPEGIAAVPGRAAIAAAVDLPPEPDETALIATGADANVVGVWLFQPGWGLTDSPADSRRASPAGSAADSVEPDQADDTAEAGHSTAAGAAVPLVVTANLVRPTSTVASSLPAVAGGDRLPLDVAAPGSPAASSSSFAASQGHGNGDVTDHGPPAASNSLPQGPLAAALDTDGQRPPAGEVRTEVPTQVPYRAVQGQANAPTGASTTMLAGAAPNPQDTAPDVAPAAGLPSAHVASDPAAVPNRDAELHPAAPVDLPGAGRTLPGQHAPRQAPADHANEGEKLNLPMDRVASSADRVSPTMPVSKQDAGSGESPQRWPLRTPAREQTGAPTGLPMTAESRLSTAAVTTAAAASAIADPAAEIELPRQIVHSIRLQALAGGGEAHVRLRPEYLGELTVAVKVERGAVTAALHAETPAVRQWIESNEASLRQGLAEHGLHLDKLTILDEAPQPESAPQDRRDRAREEQSRHEQSRHEQSRQQTPRRPRPEAGTATFEVIV